MRNYYFLRITLFYLVFFSFAAFSATRSIDIDNLKPLKKTSTFSTYKSVTPLLPPTINNIAPVITAIGDQIYCPGTSLKIVTDVTITDDDDLDTDAIYIQISSGYSNGQDLLTLTNQTSHPNIVASWNSLEGKLKLSSPIAGTKVLYTDLIAAIKDVAYSNSSTTPSGIKNFSITIGQANYLPRNKHFYEYVPDLGISWTNAKAAAETRTYYGLQGYLATLTAADEAQLAGEQAPGAGWIGGSDAETEGTWKWVTGPENGMIFWYGGTNGYTPNGSFAFWNSPQEPNNAGNENYAHITAPGIGVKGSWNDLPDAGRPSGDYQPKGYIVEYGGMIPGDVDLIQISASTSITIPRITSTTPNSRCGTGTLDLQATVTDGTINWYDASTGGNLVATGNSFTTPIINTTTTYYIDNGCTPRTPITATITPLPTANSVIIPRQCDDNQDGIFTFNTSSLESSLLNGQTNVTVTYFDQNNNPLKDSNGNLITSPFPNSFTTTSQTIKAVVTNNSPLNCFDATSIQFIVDVLPEAFAVPTSLTTTCDDEPNPLNQDGKFAFDTSTFEATILGGQTGMSVTYTLQNGTVLSTLAPTFITGTQNVLVTVTNPLNANCTATTTLNFIVNPLSIVNDISIFQCDADLSPDGKTLFNLTVNNDVISTNYTNETFTYYTSLNGAKNALAADLIPNELAFENTTPTLMDVWTRVTDKSTGCFSVAKITLKVSATNIPSNYKILIPPVCDDLLDSDGNNTVNNNNRDGITTFDLSASKATIQNLLPSTEVYNINYYRNEADALAELNVITDISNYRNIGYPNSQDVWVRVDSNLDNACYGLGPFLTINVEALPIANPVTILRQCDDNNDGIYTFDTSSLESDLLNGQNNVSVTYFDQNNNPLKDANGVLISSPFPINFTTSSQTIKAVVTNITPAQCFEETMIEFIVDDSPVAFSVPNSLTTACDDEVNPLDQDGKFGFETSAFETTILGGQNGMIVRYYNQNGIELQSPLPNPFITGTQNINVTVENPLNKNCTATTTLNFIVNPVPNIDLNLDGNSNELVCSNLSTFFVTLNAGITDNSPTSSFNYIWKKDEIDLGNNAPTLEVNAEGVYTVEVINSSGCSRTRTLTVTASNIATVDSIDIVDLTDVNSITVNVSGPGDYEYSLDNSGNFWQDSNLFDNVSAGIHEVFINDKNGCGIVSKEIVVVGIPKYFTPNNDSYNDVWEIKGMIKYPLAEVQLFDRYGKYIATLNSYNPTWDGMLNGRQLPASDYWYVITLEKDKPAIRGHFTLKR